MEVDDKTAGASQDDQIVTIAPENTELAFSVRRASLCNSSPYFVKALDGEFKEDGGSRLTFPGTDPDVLRIFVDWLHDQDQVENSTAIDALENETSERGELSTPRQMLLVKVWAFGNAYPIPRLQNAAMRRMLELFKTTYLRAETVQLAFKLTSPDSVLSEMMVRQAAHSWGQKIPHRDVVFTDKELDTLRGSTGIMREFLEIFAKKIHCDYVFGPGQVGPFPRPEEYMVLEYS